MNIQLPSIILGFLAAIGLSALIATGLLSNANLAMVDQLFAYKPTKQKTPPILLVSTTETQRKNSDFLPKLLKQLHQQSPQEVYLLRHYDSLKQVNNANKPWLDNVTYVESLHHLKASLSEATPQDLLPAEVQASSRNVANSYNISYMTDITMLAGQYRQWSPLQEFDDQIYVAFQVLAAMGNAPNQLKPHNAFNQSDNKIIDFTMEDGLLPIVTAQRVLDNAVSIGLVKDKVIIIGEAKAPGTPGFTVPLKPDVGISLLELQGYVLHSALNERFLTLSSSIIAFLGIILISFISVFLFQWLAPQISLLYTVLICGVFIALQWFSVAFHAQVLPVWEWIFTQFLTLLGVYQLRRGKEEAALNGIIAEANSRLAKRVQPSNFNRSKDPWKRILSFINQQLNLERSIFLEKISNQHRVKEIEALNCNINDISELRRDYQRSPYRDALEQNGPVVPFRKYFSNVSDAETEYLIPLTFSGEVLGFWALTLKPDEHWNQTLFENDLRNFSTQISELLYHRNHWVNQSNLTKNPWRRLLSLELGQSLHKQLTKSVTMLENRLDTLEDVFNGLSSAAVVYDVFGQVLHTNSMIEYLARINNIPIYKLTAMELMSLTGEMELDDARKKLRFVTLKNQTIAVNSQLFKSHKSHLLRIRPLTANHIQNFKQVNPFQVLGILFEFIDITQIQQHIDARHEISDKYFLELRNSLEIIHLANRQLHYSNQEDFINLTNIINKNIQNIGLITKKSEDELLNHTYMSDQQIVPLNVMAIIEKVIANLDDLTHEKNINLNFSRSDLISLCYVEPNTLEQIITAILILLIQDAAPNSIINVFSMSENNEERNQVNVNFSSMGKGIPKEQFEKALSLNQTFADNKDDPINQISILSKQVRRWGGNLNIQTEIGSGFSIDLILKTFDFSDLLRDNKKEVDEHD